MAATRETAAGGTGAEGRSGAGTGTASEARPRREADATAGRARDALDRLRALADALPRPRLRDVVVFTLPILFLEGYLLVAALLDYRQSMAFDDWYSSPSSVASFLGDRLGAALGFADALEGRQRMDPEAADPGILRLQFDDQSWQEIGGESMARWGVWADALLVRGRDAQDVEVRKRGDTSIHWLTPKKSFTLQTDRDELYKGFRELVFTVKEVLPQYVSGALAHEFGILAPETEVVPVFFNDRFHGIYRFVEPLDETFLRGDGRMPGNLYEGEVAERGEAFKGLPRGLFHYPYTWERASANDRPNADTTHALAGMLRDLHGGTLESHVSLMERLDRDELARLVAYLLVVGDPYHMDNLHNQFWYEDPSTGLLHPVVWDVRLLDLSEPPLWVNRLYRELLRDPFLADRALRVVAEELDDGLRRRAREITLRAFERYRAAFEYDLARAGTVPPVGRPEDVLPLLEGNLSLLRRWMADARVAAVAAPDGADGWIVDLESRGYAGADLLGLELEGAAAGGGLPAEPRVWADRNTNGRLDAGDAELGGRWTATDDGGAAWEPSEPLPLLPGWDTSGRGIGPGRVHYRLFVRGLPAGAEADGRAGGASPELTVRARNRITGGAAAFVRDRPGRRLGPADAWSPWAFPPAAAPRWGALPTRGDAGAPAERRMAGDVHLTSTLRVPASETLILEPGTTVRLDPDVSLVSRGRVVSRGTAERPVSFLPAVEGRPWGAFALQGPGADSSAFTHTRFVGGGGATLDRVEYIGMVNVHRARGVTFDRVEMRDNLRSDDTFHALHADVRLADCAFLRANGDAIDYDQSTGEIRGCRFVDSRNDAIDLMTSTPRIVENRISDSGDKGISVGEASQPLVFANRITGSTRGIEVKDDSEPVILHNTLTGNGIGLLQNVKNWRYRSGGWAKLAGTVVEGNRTDTLRDARSNVTLAGARIGSGGGDAASGAPEWLLAAHGLAVRGGAGVPEAWEEVPAARVVDSVAYRETFRRPAVPWTGADPSVQVRVRGNALVVSSEARRGVASRPVSWDVFEMDGPHVAVFEVSARDAREAELRVVGADGGVIRRALPDGGGRTFRYVEVELPPGRYERLELEVAPLPGTRRMDPRTGLQALIEGRVYLRGFRVYELPRDG